jgi:uncharacterized protein
MDLNTALIRAIEEEDYDKITKLVKNAISSNNDPLIHACKIGNVKIAEILIDNGMTIDNFCFLNSCYYEQSDILRLLLQKNTNPDINYPKLLKIASVNHFLDIFKILLEKNININSIIYENYDILQNIYENGDLEFIQSIIDKGLDINNTKINPLIYACHLNNIELVKLLLDNNANINICDQAAIITACRNNNFDIVKLLLENNADINARKGWPLAIASKNNFHDIVKLLLQYDVDICSIDENYIQKIYYNNSEIIELLFEKGICANSPNYYALCVACEQNKYHVVRLFVNMGLNVDLENGKLLQIVCAHNHLKIARFLLRKNADPNINNGKALAIATHHGHHKIVKLLIKYKINLKLYGPDALKEASFMFHDKVVKLLIKNNVDVCNIHERFLSFIYQETTKKSLKLIKLLIDKKIDINQMDGYALVTACKNNNYDLIRLLLDKGANPSLCFQNVLVISAKQNNAKAVSKLLEFTTVPNFENLVLSKSIQKVVYKHKK